MDTDEKDSTGLSPEWFGRVDESDDAVFYQTPRLVAHIDDVTITALTDYYREAIPAGGVVLDLMSSIDLSREIFLGFGIGFLLRAFVFS